MKLQERISILSRLGEYLTGNSEALQQAKARAYRQNAWFVPEFTDLAIANIAAHFLQEELLEKWAHHYDLPDETPKPALVGITMAGNIPLVGFHDLLTMFMAGHQAMVKPSSKDDVLIRHIMDTLVQWDHRIAATIRFADRLTGCNAYIATGSNNTSRYFEYYFGKYPHIIRRNRTSVGILTGHETPGDLEKLADDILLYFGLGCRNISKLYVPAGYNWEPLLNSFGKYHWMKDHNKFRNNYDYQLSLLILNNKYYMSNEVLLLVESPELFSPIAQVNYEYYEGDAPIATEKFKDDLQCLCGHTGTPFGIAQQPSLTDYADGVDTMDLARKLYYL
ncbi:MAG TPA: acyl-CoA reductase [Phnomibacter sp.]|nr:acyl-CoA reductase [Phnomibacter sp.]